MNGKPSMKISMIVSIVSEYLAELVPDDKMDDMIDKFEDLKLKELEKKTSSFSKFKRATEKMLEEL
jgi:hypothetical protein